ncbi:MAG: single-stranded-DNA-specific exonuclease RecJ, partial [Gammaproteobacteria bacterium]|nr:single-stranded-DNA-specific exonuclease RecJ [Gammaproteobacteria bacterium]
AVALLEQAIQENQKILIIGDFDADGATSATLALCALSSMGAKQANYLVPNRFDFGYGLTPAIVDVALQDKPDLIITVDNGISSVDGVSHARKHGIEVIVTDHHLPPEQLPNASAIINPNLHDDPFPGKSLAGVGVIFYVMSALRSHLRESGWFKEQGIKEPNLAEFLDLVALGTVADLVSLDKHNRILVAQGVARINKNQCRPGIQALLEVGKRDTMRVTASDLGFYVAPRLNAAGRLDDISTGIECLLTDDLAHARELAEELHNINTERRAIEADMQQQANAIVNKLKHADRDTVPLGLCLYEPEWHQGIVGLVASRVKDRTQRPVVAFAPGKDSELKGSARSIPGLHIRDVFQLIDIQQPDLITRYGGHAMAAGLSIEQKNFPAFKLAFESTLRKLLNEDDLDRKLYTDGELDENDFNLELAGMLSRAAPWGKDFPEPLFDGKFEVINQRIVGEQHLKLSLRPDNTNKTLDAIAFRLIQPGEKVPQLTHIRAAYRLDINEYQGTRRVQLIVEYLESL